MATGLVTKSEGDEAVDALRRFISRGEYGVREVPNLLREILEHGYWRERGRGFSSFPAFVEADPPPGLGTELRMIRQLVMHDADTLDLLDRATQGKDGRRPKTFDNVQGFRAPTGNDRQTALRRLRKDRPDLHARVLLPKKHPDHLTPHGAMVEAGFRPRAYRLPMTVSGLRHAILRHFSPEQIRELVAALGEERP